MPELDMLVAHWLSLWLGFYLLSRRPRAAATVLAGCAYVAMSAYLLSTAILIAPEHVPAPLFWGGVFGGLIPFAPALLLHAFLRLAGKRPHRERLLPVLVYAAAFAGFLLGLSDTLLYEYEEASAGATTDVNGVIAIGPPYPIQVVQICATLVLAALALLPVDATWPASAHGFALLKGAALQQGDGGHGRSQLSGTDDRLHLPLGTTSRVQLRQFLTTSSFTVLV